MSRAKRKIFSRHVFWHDKWEGMTGDVY
ncbi:hypothetical protein [Porphyromonas gulae]|nr:hypothetical protein [Porphyromonas gulae]